MIARIAQEKMDGGMAIETGAEMAKIGGNEIEEGMRNDEKEREVKNGG